MFGVVPRPLWAPRRSPDSRNRIRAGHAAAARARRADHAHRRRAGRQGGRRGFRTSTASIGRGTSTHALAEAGLAPEDIDIVLATHLHFDHAGGFTVRDAAGGSVRGFRARATSSGAANGRMRRTRTSATAPAICRTTSCRSPTPACWSSSTTTRPSCPACASGGPAGIRRTIRWSIIESGGRQAAYVGDLMPTAAHVPAGVDHGVRSLSDGHARRQEGASSQEAQSNRTLVFFPHDPAVAAGYRRRASTGRPRFEPAHA